MSSGNVNPAFEEFFNKLEKNKYYLPEELCAKYTKAMKIDPMDKYNFITLPIIIDHFDICRAVSPFGGSFTVLIKKNK